MKTSSSSIDSPNSKPKHHLLAAIFLGIGVISILIGGFFGMRISRRFHERPPFSLRQKDVSLIQDWMTLRYIARTYGTPEPELEKALNLEPGKYHQSTLSQIAETLGQPQDQLVEQVKQVISSFQTSHPDPPDQ